MSEGAALEPMGTVSGDPTGWTTARSAELYGVEAWGSGYFGISPSGCVEVYPRGDTEGKIDLLEVVEGLRARGLNPPVVVRLPGVLAHRMEELRRVFDEAIAEGGYDGTYTCVYPIKVNQQRHLCEEIRDLGSRLGFGLEAGSKPELLAGLALTEGFADMPLICNGFKDAEFIETTILAAKMGRRVLPVIEQVPELELLAASAKVHGVTPNFGIRAKLASAGTGRWADSGGLRGKFGLSPSQMIAAVEALRERDLLGGLRMLHCHIGSQIADIRTFKYAVSELAHLYVELVRLGAPLGSLDLGGGLGVDYDGSQSASDSSVNYTLEQYAADLVYRVKAVCDDAGVAHPDIVTESGRAMVAHSGVLIFQVLGARILPEAPDQSLVSRALEEVPEPEVPQPLLDMVDAYGNLQEGGDPLEIHHDAEHALNEAVSLFGLGYMSITARAATEELYWAIVHRVLRALEDDPPEDLADLPDTLSDIYYANFSVFQSLIDAWGIDQIFPVMPIHRLAEEPTRRGTLADITCDSDGKVTHFPGEGAPARSLPLHALVSTEEDNGPSRGCAPYYLGVFLTGAYQETLGDLHNLFGDTHAVHVALDEDGGWRLEEVVEGDSVREVLRYVQFDPDTMLRSLLREVEAALAAKRLTLDEAVSMRRFMHEGIEGYTYLE